jgi:hypothetical protein
VVGNPQSYIIFPIGIVLQQTIPYSKIGENAAISTASQNGCNHFHTDNQWSLHHHDETGLNAVNIQYRYAVAFLGRNANVLRIVFL